MKKISVIIPNKKSNTLIKLLSENKIKRFISKKTKNNFNFEIIATEIQTEKLIDLITKELKIHKGKKSKEGYITVIPIDIVEPYIYDKGDSIELEQLLLSDIKDFVKFDKNYVLFIVCAAILTSIAFMLDNLYILIGAMIIGPLMNPIMAASYGLVKNNITIIKKGLINEFAGILLIGFTVFIVSFFFNPTLDLELSLISNNFILSFILALVIGIVASTSFLTGKFEAQTGVAISISLIPPLASSVILFLAKDYANALNALIAFAINVFGLHLSSFFSFLIVYFIREKKQD